MSSPNDSKQSSRDIATQLLGAPGFLSFVGVTIGRWMHTIVAWETPEAARDIRSQPAHREAVARMLGPDIAWGGPTGIWAPWHLNGRIVRRSSCDKMTRVR